jgi:hypothetical protein
MPNTRYCGRKRGKDDFVGRVCQSFENYRGEMRLKLSKGRKNTNFYQIYLINTIA